MAILCDQAGRVRAGEELDIVQLLPFLLEHFGHDGPVSVEQFPSGHSNLTYLVRMSDVRLGDARRGDRELVLRRPPFGSKVRSAHDMAREYRVLSKLHAAYPVAPKAVLYCDDLSILNAPFYLMEPIRGTILRRNPPPGVAFPPETARRLSEAFVDNLVRLHQLDYAAVGLADLGKPQGYLERQVNGWIARYHNSKTHDLPEVELISRWLIERMPASGDAALIHNDYKYDNVVLDPDDLTKIVGVLDWEMCTLGDPLTDLATALAYWTDPNDPEEFQEISSAPTTLPGTLTRAQLVERYAGATGRDHGLDTRDMVFYLTFARFKIAVIVQQIYYRYAQGLTRDARFAEMPTKIHTLLRASWHCAESGAI
jgi:aminoglycoside phosphotransferase (APT) family kinase protein